MRHLPKILGFSLLSILGLVIGASSSGAEVGNLVVPDINLVLLVALVLSPGGLAGLFMAFALGLFVDAASSGYLGLSSFSFVVTWLFVRALSEKLFTDQALGLAFLCFVAALVKGLVLVALFNIYFDFEVFHWPIIRTITLQAIVTGMVAPLVFFMLEMCGFCIKSSAGASRLAGAGTPGPQGSAKKHSASRFRATGESLFRPRQARAGVGALAPKTYRSGLSFGGARKYGRSSSSHGGGGGLFRRFFRRP